MLLFQVINITITYLIPLKEYITAFRYKKLLLNAKQNDQKVSYILLATTRPNVVLFLFEWLMVQVSRRKIVSSRQKSGKTIQNRNKNREKPSKVPTPLVEGDHMETRCPGRKKVGEISEKVVRDVRF